MNIDWIKYKYYRNKYKRRPRHYSLFEMFIMTTLAISCLLFSLIPLINILWKLGVI